MRIAHSVFEKKLFHKKFTKFTKFTHFRVRGKALRRVPIACAVPIALRAFQSLRLFQ